MKLGYCYKTKEGMYSITVDEELLNLVLKDVKNAIKKEAVDKYIDSLDVYTVWNLSGIYVELNELQESEGV